MAVGAVFWVPHKPTQPGSAYHGPRSDALTLCWETGAELIENAREFLIAMYSQTDTRADAIDQGEEPTGGDCLD
jgi:hypothetical protein